MIEQHREKTLRALLFIGSALVSVFLLDSVVSDPVNSPKLFILGIIATGVLGTVFYRMKMSEIRQNLFPILMLLIFLILGFATLITSPAPVTQSFYGVYGRNNGLLTYILFAFMFIGGLFVSSHATHEKIIHGLLLAGIINVIYCGWVLVFGDFIGWSNPYGNILGTFGNPNFIGAFLGLFFVTWVALLLGPRTSRNFKFASILVLPIAGFEIYMSRAIQGRVLMAVGVSVVLFFWIRSKFESTKFLIFYSMTISIIGGFALAGALQAGPLTNLIYKTSVSLRGQYWLSAWNTGNSHPWTGVGFDSLGDWYRRMRSARAIELPGVDTVINTAHNVPLDMFAFGGWPLLFVYLVLIFWVALQCLKFTVHNKGYDRIFVALFVAWVCYQLQSIISINQIGIGFWGWLLSGALLSYLKIFDKGLDKASAKKSIRTKDKSRKKMVVVSSNLVAGLSMVAGGIIAVPPLAADMKWISAQLSRDALRLEEALIPSYLNPQNSQKYSIAIRIFEQSDLPEFSHKYAKKALEFNPNVYENWKLFSLLKKTNDEEKKIALLNMKRLDPLNPALESNL